MAYGTPMQNQNKGYAAQEKKDLLGDMPIDKVASGGSWMSKHVSSPLAMGKAHGMAPKMEGDTPLEQTETPEERKARIKKENQAELARLAAVKAAREKRKAKEAQEPKPEQQTRLQALKARIVSDLTGKTGTGGPFTPRN